MLFDQKMKSNTQTTPKSPLKFDGGSFGRIKLLIGSESEILRFDQPTEVIIVETTSVNATVKDSS